MIKPIDQSDRGGGFWRAKLATPTPSTWHHYSGLFPVSGLLVVVPADVPRKLQMIRYYTLPRSGKLQAQ